MVISHPLSSAIIKSIQNAKCDYANNIMCWATVALITKDGMGNDLQIDYL